MLLVVTFLCSGCIGPRARYAPRVENLNRFSFQSDETVNEAIDLSLTEQRVSQQSALIAMSPRQAVHRAIQFAEIDELAEREKATFDRVNPHIKKHFCSLIELSKRLIDVAAETEKENHAARVLEIYLALAEVHAQADVLVRSQQAFNRLNVQIREAKELGLNIEISEQSLLRRQLALDQNRAKLRNGGQALTEQLKALVGIKNQHPIIIWTNCNLGLQTEKPNLQNETQLAFSNRADLRALSIIARQSSKDVSEVAEVSLNSFHPSFGSLGPTSNSRFGLLRRWLPTSEMGQLIGSDRRGQIELLQQGLVSKIRAEVAARVFGIQNNIDQLQIQRKIVASWSAEKTQLEQLRQIGKAEYAELIAPEFERLAAESELFHKAYQLEAEWIKLAHSRGTLLEDLLGPDDCNGFDQPMVETQQTMIVAGEYLVDPNIDALLSGE